MNITPLILAGFMNVAEPVQIPMTEELYISVNQSVASALEVCKKNKVEEKPCMDVIVENVKKFRALADEVCKAYPEEVIPCIQYGLGMLMDNETRKNISILNSKSI